MAVGWGFTLLESLIYVQDKIAGQGRYIGGKWWGARGVQRLNCSLILMHLSRGLEAGKNIMIIFSQRKKVLSYLSH